MDWKGKVKSALPTGYARQRVIGHWGEGCGVFGFTGALSDRTQNAVMTQSSRIGVFLLMRDDPH